MPTATVNANGAELAYIDSGAPESSGLYTTLVIIHGYCWNGNTFQKAVTSAPSHGLRIIALNRRDYAGSSPFTPEEIAPIQAKDCSADTLRAFLRDRSAEYAEFLRHIIEQGGIAPRSRANGGIVLLAWSLGNVFGLNFLENVAGLPEALRTLITTYVREYIIYDPPFEAVALPPPAPDYSEWSNKILAKFVDPSDPGNLENLMQGANAINDWLSGWFSYSSSCSDPVERFVKSNERPIHESTRQKEEANPAFNACNNFSAFRNENTIMRGIYNDVFHSTARALVLSPDSTTVLWPELEIRYLHCENACWTTAYAASKTQEKFAENGNSRKVDILKDANHFVHWENPEQFLKGVLSVL